MIFDETMSSIVTLGHETKTRLKFLISNFDINVRISKSVDFLFGNIFNFPYGNKLG
jgi:hypothetical protein